MEGAKIFQAIHSGLIGEFHHKNDLFRSIVLKLSMAVQYKSIFGSKLISEWLQNLLLDSNPKYTMPLLE